jgi:hypothetical protein
MRDRRPEPSKLLPPVRKPQHAHIATPTGKNISWIEGYAATTQKELSVHQLTAALAALGAPIVLSRPLPTVARELCSEQLSNRNWTNAGTVEVHGARYVTFHVVNDDDNENGILARPFRIIGTTRYIDDSEDPYSLFSGFGVRIPVPTDCEVVGLEVKDFVDNSHALYSVGVSLTP